MKGNNIRIREITSIDEAREEIRAISGNYQEIKENFEKLLFRTIKASDLDARAANLLKQTALEIGIDAIISKDVSLFSATKSDVLILGTLNDFERLYYKLKTKPFELSNFAEEMKEVLLKYDNELSKIKIEKTTFDFNSKTYVMGILNLTPDSFSDGGKYIDVDEAVKKAKQMEKDGADIIDIGAESSRPGAEKVSIEEELKRLNAVVDRIMEEVNIPISIDTYKVEVAEAMLKKGIRIINDITGLKGDSKMADIISDYNAVVIVMHMQGNPQIMQNNPVYDEIIGDIINEFKSSIRIAQVAGIKDKNLILDPGIGFGKTLKHNLKLLNKLDEFRSLGLPILVGTSKKSFLGEITKAEVQDRKEESLAAAIISAQNGANIIRVHDVKETVKAMKVVDAVKFLEKELI
ncbi:MAG: dihydropteroate synthase [Fusobacteriia bacterium 4572_132]|nr:MAG: dihydropteroate synthase [Fusobacteriia bacterium 4572_132]